jgi:hypothetical protein
MRECEMHPIRLRYGLLERNVPAAPLVHGAYCRGKWQNKYGIMSLWAIYRFSTFPSAGICSNVLHRIREGRFNNGITTLRSSPLAGEDLEVGDMKETRAAQPRLFNIRLDDRFAALGFKALCTWPRRNARAIFTGTRLRLTWTL